MGESHFREFSFSTDYALDGVTAGGTGIRVSGMPVRNDLQGAGAATLRYLPDGEGNGAQVLTRYVDGVDTGASLWPWPHENRSQRDFRNHGGLPPERGFCADGDALDGRPITVSSYI